MTEIEDLVRRSLADQVRTQPAATGIADRAVAGAATVRRRHAALTAGTVLLVVVAAIAGSAWLRRAGTPPSRPPSVSPSPSVPTIAVSALIGGVDLLLPDGRRLPVTRGGTQTADAAYQIHDGWLVSSTAVADPQRGSLWLYRPDGTSGLLVEGASAVIVSADGQRLAWRSGNTLVVGHLDATDQMVQDATTTTDRGYPVLFVGSAVVLAYSATGGGLDNWDVWDPRHGRYTPSWSRVQANGVLAVLGATSDGRYAIGQTLVAPGSGSKDTCLARLDPTDALRVVTPACGLPDPAGPAAQSPDGHWLAYASGTRTVVVDATARFTSPPPVAIWSPSLSGVWIGRDTYLGQGPDGHFYRYRVGRPGAEPVDIAGLPAGIAVDLVPTLS